MLKKIKHIFGFMSKILDIYFRYLYLFKIFVSILNIFYGD